jgi:hypothetical protein
MGNEAALQHTDRCHAVTLEVDSELQPDSENPSREPAKEKNRSKVETNRGEGLPHHNSSLKALQAKRDLSMCLPASVDEIRPDRNRRVRRAAGKQCGSSTGMKHAAHSNRLAEECAVEMLDDSVRLKSTAETIRSCAETTRHVYGNTPALPSDVTFSATGNFAAGQGFREQRSSIITSRRKTRSTAPLVLAGDVVVAGDKRFCIAQSQSLRSCAGSGKCRRATPGDRPLQADRNGHLFVV